MRDLLASTGWSKWVPSHDRHRIGISYGWVTSQNTRHLPGQIIATSHDLTPNGGLVREIPLFQGNLGW